MFCCCVIFVKVNKTIFLNKTGGLSEGAAAHITEHQFGGWMVKRV